MKLARMLMVGKDSGHTAIDMLGHEQEGPDALIGLHCVFDGLSHVPATIGCFQKNSIKWASDWKRAKKPFQIIAIHDLQHRAEHPLVNSVLGSRTGCLAGRSSFGVDRLCAP
jgi:hypothetical protein